MLRSIALVAFTALITLAAGCASSSESAGRSNLAPNIGKYDSPPAGIDKPRVGVPPFETTGSGSSKELNGLAADQLTTLVTDCDRFEVIERAQINQNLKEQGLEGVVDPNEIARSGKIHGCDFLMLGKVSNLRVKAEKANRNFGLGNVRLPGGGGIGGFDFKRSDSTITAECGVDIRLVDSTGGSVRAAQHSDFTRTDTIGAFGVQILGVGADANADLQLDEDNKGLILRMALDDALRQMLPKIDKFLLARGKEMRAKAAAEAPAAAAAAPAGAAAAPAAETPKDAVAKKFCSSCGKPLAAGAKFCADCGTKTE